MHFLIAVEMLRCEALTSLSVIRQFDRPLYKVNDGKNKIGGAILTRYKQLVKLETSSFS